MKESNSPKGCSGGTPSVFRVNTVPIVHFDFPDRDLGDEKAAAKWAWKCLQQVARMFCQEYCNRSICNIGEKEHDRPIEEPRDARLDAIRKKSHEGVWRTVQRNFHEAMSFFPQCKHVLEGCPACAVVKAFTYFPQLAFDSPIPPVTVAYRNGIDFDPVPVYFPGDYLSDQVRSMPCCVVVTGYPDFMWSTEEVIREKALLALDLDELPVYLPPLAANLIAALQNGKAVLVEMDKVINPGLYAVGQPEERGAAPETEAANNDDVVEPPHDDSGKVIIEDKGDVYSLRLGEKTVLLRRTKGLQYIALLIGSPNRDFLATELRAVVNKTQGTGRRVGSGEAEENGRIGDEPDSPTELADKRAMADYRKRRQELTREIELAEEQNDLFRKEELEKERTEVESEIKRLMGFGGRLRKDIPYLERARTAVSNAINRAMKRIQEDHFELWRHLNGAMTRGQFFRYRTK